MRLTTLRHFHHAAQSCLPRSSLPQDSSACLSRTSSAFPPFPSELPVMDSTAPKEIVLTNGKVLWTRFDDAIQRHVIQCDLCGFKCRLTKHAHPKAFIDHRGSKGCERSMLRQRRELGTATGPSVVVCQLIDDADGFIEVEGALEAPCIVPVTPPAQSSVSRTICPPTPFSNHVLSLPPNLSDPAAAALVFEPALTVGLNTNAGQAAGLQAVLDRMSPPCSRSPSPSPPERCNECAGVRVRWIAGSAWDSYPFHHHKYPDMHPWDLVRVEDNVWLILRSHSCTQQVDRQFIMCQHCQQLPFTAMFRRFVETYSQDASDYTKRMCLNQRQLLALLQRVSERLKRLQVKVSNTFRLFSTGTYSS